MLKTIASIPKHLLSTHFFVYVPFRCNCLHKATIVLNKYIPEYIQCKECNQFFIVYSTFETEKVKVEIYETNDYPSSCITV